MARVVTTSTPARRQIKHLILVRQPDGQWTNAPMLGLLDPGDVEDNVERLRRLHGQHGVRAVEVPVPAPVTHLTTVTITTDEVLVLTCACGWSSSPGSSAPLDALVELADMHRAAEGE